MEINVGDYVRTKYKIAKVINTKTYCNLIIETDKGDINIDNIVKNSNSIIDLIEVGDYVNGFRVDKVEARYIWFGDDSVTLAYKFNYDKFSIKTEDIKSIVTKEAFSSVEYRVESN